MKHYKRTTGFSQLKKKPSRKLRKAIENFLRRVAYGTRDEARDVMRVKLWAHGADHTFSRKGLQNTIRIGAKAHEDMLPDILANDFVLGYCRNGFFKSRSTIAKH